MSIVRDNCGGRRLISLLLPSGSECEENKKKKRSGSAMEAHHTQERPCGTLLHSWQMEIYHFSSRGTRAMIERRKVEVCILDQVSSYPSGNP